MELSSPSSFQAFLVVLAEWTSYKRHKMNYVVNMFSILRARSFSTIFFQHAPLTLDSKYVQDAAL